MPLPPDGRIAALPSKVLATHAKSIDPSRPGSFPCLRAGGNRFEDRRAVAWAGILLLSQKAINMSQ